MVRWAGTPKATRTRATCRMFLITSRKAEGPLHQIVEGLQADLGPMDSPTEVHRSTEIMEVTPTISLHFKVTSRLRKSCSRSLDPMDHQEAQEWTTTAASRTPELSTTSSRAQPTMAQAATTTIGSMAMTGDLPVVRTSTTITTIEVAEDTPEMARPAWAAVPKATEAASCIALAPITTTETSVQDLQEEARWVAVVPETATLAVIAMMTAAVTLSAAIDARAKGIGPKNARSHPKTTAVASEAMAAAAAMEVPRAICSNRFEARTSVGVVAPD